MGVVTIPAISGFVGSEGVQGSGSTPNKSARMYKFLLQRWALTSPVDRPNHQSNTPARGTHGGLGAPKREGIGHHASMTARTRRWKLPARVPRAGDRTTGPEHREVRMQRIWIS